MKTTCLKVGLRLTLNEASYEIVKIVLPDMIHLERLTDGGLICRRRQELLDELAEGKLILNGENAQASMRVTGNLECLDEKSRESVETRYKYISSAISKLGNSCTTVGLKEVISHVTEKIGCLIEPSLSTVYGWWKSYEMSDYDIMSLVKRKSGKKGPRAFSEIVLNLFAEVVDQVYLTREKRPAKAAYDLLKYRVGVLNERRIEPLACPSQAQFYRMLNAYDKYDVMRAREGKKAAEDHFRTSGKGVSVRYILERVEIDHSQLNVFVTDERDGLPLGRPYITAVIDCFSRMLLGWHLGFEPPSNLSVMRALRHAIMPKSNHPTYGIPTVLVCDNGAEFHSSALKGLCYELAIDLQYCPKQQPQYKGTIERVMGTLNREVCQALRGTSFSDIEARGDYESIENAEVTLEELIGLINRWILNDYSMRIHRGTRRVPSALWKEGLEIIEPNLPESAMKLEFAMTEKTTRTLTHKGIEIFNNFYNSPSLRVIRTRMTENQTVTVRYDVEDLGAIWVLDSVSNEYLKVPCDEREYAEGLTLVTHRHLRKTLNDKGRGEQNEKALLEHRARFNSEVNALGRSKKIRSRQRFARLKENMTTSKVSINAITAKAEAPVVTEPFVIDDSLSFDTNNVGGAK